MYLKVPRSIGIYLVICGGGKPLSLYWYECRMDILTYMHVGMKGILMGSDRNLLWIYWNLLEKL